MRTTPGRLFVLCFGLVMILLSSTTAAHQPDEAGAQAQDESSELGENQADKPVLRIHYLEIVTPSVNETCEKLELAHGVTFGDPVPQFGNARTAKLQGGGRIGVRAPLRETEVPVVRPYVLVDDIHAAVQAAEDKGAQVAIPPLEIPGQGTFAVYLLGGIEHGLWQTLSGQA